MHTTWQWQRSSWPAVVALAGLGLACGATAAEGGGAAPPLDLSLRLSPEPRAPALLNMEQGLWARRGRVSLGLQARWQTLRPAAEGPGTLPPAALSSEPASLHMGVAVDLGARTRVELTQALASGAPAGHAALPGTTPGEAGMRLSLQLRPAKPMEGLGNGFRVALDSRSRLTLKPRGGGLAVQYNSSF